MTTRIMVGDCLEQLRALPAESVHCAVTSPPYYGLRDYGTATWEGGDPGCDHRSPTMRDGRNEDRPKLAGSAATNSGQLLLAAKSATCGKCGATRKDKGIGLEATPEAHIARLVEVFREVRRVLRKDGVLWLNYGDAYAAGGNGARDPERLPKQSRNDHRVEHSKSQAGKPKDLLMLPARVALALQADGWWLRSMLPWVKRSAMPESATDRPATAIEYVFMLTKSARYYFDMEAVRVAHNDLAGPPSRFGNTGANGGQVAKADGLGGQWDPGKAPGGRDYNPAGRNLRNSDLFFASLAPPHGLISGAEPLALDVNPAGFAEAHFATFPPKLVEPLIKAATSERGVCPECGAPWAREVEKSSVTPKDYDGKWSAADPQASGRRMLANVRARREAGNDHDNPFPAPTTTGWSPSCACDAEPVPATVLDPFGGAGTTALVADRLGRDAVLIELNPAYAEMARKRIAGDAPLFAEVGP